MRTIRFLVVKLQKRKRGDLQLASFLFPSKIFIPPCNLGNIRAHICFFSSHLSRLNPNQYPNQNTHTKYTKRIQTSQPSKLLKAGQQPQSLYFPVLAKTHFPEYAKTQFEKAKIICKTLIEIIENLGSRKRKIIF